MKNGGQETQEENKCTCTLEVLMLPQKAEKVRKKMDTEVWLQKWAFRFQGSMLTSWCMHRKWDIRDFNHSNINNRRAGELHNSPGVHIIFWGKGETRLMYNSPAGNICTTHMGRKLHLQEEENMDSGDTYSRHSYNWKKSIGLSGLKLCNLRIICKDVPRVRQRNWECFLSFSKENYSWKYRWRDEGFGAFWCSLIKKRGFFLWSPG